MIPSDPSQRLAGIFSGLHGYHGMGMGRLSPYVLGTKHGEGFSLKAISDLQEILGILALSPEDSPSYLEQEGTVAAELRCIRSLVNTINLLYFSVPSTHCLAISSRRRQDASILVGTPHATHG